MHVYEKRVSKRETCTHMYTHINKKMLRSEIQNLKLNYCRM